MKKILQPVYIYPLMVFIGFFSNYQYFDFFDIDISKHLTFNELLMSFMPMTNFLFLLIAVVTFFIIYAVINKVLQYEQEDTSDEVLDEDIKSMTGHSFKELKQLFKDKKWKSFSKYALLLNHSFMSITGVILIAFLIVYPIEFISAITNKPWIGIDPALLFIFGFFWLGVFDNFISKKFKELKDLRTQAIAFLFFLIVMGFSFLGIRNQAEDVLNGKPKYQVSFKFNDRDIKTDSSLVFVGQTEKYFILRNLLLKKNDIYSKEKIDLIEMIKIEYKK